LANDVGTVEKHSLHYTKVVGSSPAADAANGKENTTRKSINRANVMGLKPSVVGLLNLSLLSAAA